MFRSISADARKTRFVTAALAKAEGKSDQLKVWIWYAHYSKTGGWNWHPYIHWHPYIVCTWIFVQEKNRRQTISLTTFCHLKSYEKAWYTIITWWTWSGWWDPPCSPRLQVSAQMQILDTGYHIIENHICQPIFWRISNIRNILLLASSYIRWNLFICKYGAEKKSEGKWEDLKQLHDQQIAACSGLAGKLVDTDQEESPADSFIWSDLLIKTVTDSPVSNTMEQKQWWGDLREKGVKPAADFLQSPKLGVGLLQRSNQEHIKSENQIWNKFMYKCIKHVL